MSALLLPGRFSQQPQQHARIDWGNPITRGLVFAYNLGAPAGGISVASQTAGGNIVFTPKGMARQTTSGSSDVILDNVPTTATGANYSMLAVGTANSTSTTQSAVDDDTDTSSPRVFQFRLNSAKGELITFDTSGNPYFATASAMSLAQLQAGFVLGAQVAGNSIALFQNGIKTGGSASNTQRTGSGTVRIGQHKGVAGAGWTTGGLCLVAQWARTLSDAEFSSLTDNPWQLFAAPPRRLWGIASSGTTTTLTPGVDTLAITGYTPTLVQSANQTVAPGVGSLSITGYAPTLAQGANQSVNPATGTLTITGYAPTLAQSANQSVAPGVSSLALTGYAPTIVQNTTTTVSPGVGALTITGYVPTLAQSANQTVAPGVRTLAIAGFAPTLTQSNSFGMTPSTRTMVLTGYAPSVSQAGPPVNVVIEQILQNKKPSIPALSTLPSELAQVLNPIKENLEILTGVRGTPLSKVATTATTDELITAINAIVSRLNASGT